MLWSLLFISTVLYNLMLTDHLHRGSEAKRCIKEVGLDDLLSFFYHKSLAPQSFGVGVHLDTRISTAFISFSVSCASVS